MGVTLVNYNTEQRGVENLLKSLDRPGDYCVHAKLVTSMPTLVVDPVGTIAFPVQEAQLGALIRAAERAPYGKGPDTVLDTSVRDSWQIDREAFQLGGPGWPPTLKKILGRVAKGLGCDRERLEARPYKLLVYEPGGFFQPHRDTEKQVGMIGTLVVSLPTAGSGGELVVTHMGREQVIDLCVEDVGALAFAAFYADCTHETRPVRTGHRVSLVFNLILRGAKSAEAGRAPDFQSQADALGTLLEDWVGDPKGTEKIVWLLEHDYSRAGLSFEALKGKDDLVARTLAAAAEQAECTVHAAIVHITETGSPDYTWGYDEFDELEMGEVFDADCTLEDWIALDGSRPQYGTLRLMSEELMPNGALDDAYPDDKWVEEASGNAGASVEHVYRNAALVVWPTKNTLRMLSASDISAAIEYIASEAARIRKGSGDRAPIKALGAQLIDAWDEEAKRNRLYDSGGEKLRKMLTALDSIGSAELTARFILKNAVSAYQGHGNDELSAALATAGADAAKDFLPSFVRVQLARHPQRVLDLLWSMTETHWHGGTGAWRVPLQAAGTVVFDTLPRVLKPPARKNAPAWQQPTPQGPGEETIAVLFSLAARLGLRAEADEAVRLLSKHYSPGPRVKSVLKVLAKMRKRDAGVTKSTPYLVLWQAAAEFLLERSGTPPEPPRNWIIDARLGCSCKACRQLGSFCADPYRKSTKIGVARPLRKHLRSKIDALNLDIDYETERSGSPFKLVCTKNRASYQRRLDRYRDDVVQMKALIAAVPDMDESRRESENLERLRNLTRPSH